MVADDVVIAVKFLIQKLPFARMESHKRENSYLEITPVTFIGAYRSNGKYR